MRVLIVEDEFLISFYLETILEEAGHTVVGMAADMHAALKIAQFEQIDAAIMDVDLARGSSGFETARLLREQHALPSLFVTGRVTPEVRRAAEKWPPFLLITKPYTNKDILTGLAKLTD
jgi:DNA-binding response OmpR family regulator